MFRRLASLHSTPAGSSPTYAAVPSDQWATRGMASAQGDTSRILDGTAAACSLGLWQHPRGGFRPRTGMRHLAQPDPWEGFAFSLTAVGAMQTRDRGIADLVTMNGIRGTGDRVRKGASVQEAGETHRTGLHHRCVARRKPDPTGRRFTNAILTPAGIVVLVEAALTGSRMGMVTRSVSAADRLVARSAWRSTGNASGAEQSTASGQGSESATEQERGDPASEVRPRPPTRRSTRG